MREYSVQHFSVILKGVIHIKLLYPSPILLFIYDIEGLRVDEISVSSLRISYLKLTLVFII